jgi:hypothetical protein
MRDPARIDIILAALREAWLQAPDERLGQFLDNCALLDRDEYFSNFRLLEDDKWLEAIKSRFPKKWPSTDHP